MAPWLPAMKLFLCAAFGLRRMPTPNHFPLAGASDVTVVVACIVLAVSTVAAIESYRRRSAPSLPVVLAVALLIRLAFVVLARHSTPSDVAVFFLRTFDVVRQGHDPATTLPRYWWNFLPLMPYVHALEQLTGLPWWTAGKICPVVADIGIVGLLARLTGRVETAWQYALNPIAVLVSAWHGQVEPTSLALVLGSLLALRRERFVMAGLVFGLAVATKTWPVIFLPGLFLGMTWGQRGKFTASVLPPLLSLFGSQVFFLHSSAAKAVDAIFGYRSIFGNFGWSAVLNRFGVSGFGYSGPGIDRYVLVGTVVLAVGSMILVVWCWKRVDGLILTGLLLLVFYVVTPGFGVQFLLWCVPVLLILDWEAVRPFLAFAALFVSVAYLLVYTGIVGQTVYLELSCAVVAAAIWAIVDLLGRFGRPDGAGQAVTWGVARTSGRLETK